MFNRNPRRVDPDRYAAAVLRVLAEEFPDDLRDPVTAEIVTKAIKRHVFDADETLEVIVDNPTLANWRLKADRNNPQRVRLSCYRLNETDRDRERRRRVNAALAAIPED